MGRTPNFDKLKERGDVRGLIKALGHKDPWVREIAVKVLGDIGGGVKAASALAKMLKDKNSKVRFHAAFALAHITMFAYDNARDRRAISALIEALIDENEDVRYYAADALGVIGPGTWEVFANMAAAKKVVPTLIKALKDKKRDVRQAAKWALDKIRKR